MIFLRIMLLAFTVKISKDSRNKSLFCWNLILAIFASLGLTFLLCQQTLVAYQDRIKADELQSLVQQATNNGSKPLELLVLSACETARSDRRAILGLAGITVRSGARSTLSTLWKADDRATTILMTKFYQQLSQPGITKAEVLRQAQLSLMAEEGYYAPHFWATYLLVGSWL